MFAKLLYLDGLSILVCLYSCKNNQFTSKAARMIKRYEPKKIFLYLCWKTAKIGCTSAKHASKLDAFVFGLHYLCRKTKHIDSIDESIIDQW